MPDPAARYVGAPLPRKEDPPLLRGEARFVADLSLPGRLHACVVRSTHASARVEGIAVERALAVPGVSFVLTAAELPPDVPPIPLRVPGPPEVARFLQPPLAGDRVRYVGEPVAVVVADGAYAAEDAAEEVVVEYDPLPAATLDTGETACVLRQRVGDWSAALASAHVVVEETFATNRLTGVPLECRGLLAEYAAATGELTVWGAAKVPHFNRSALAVMLGLPETRVRLVACHVGGGFGVRGELYPEDFLIPYLALRLRRPVRWIEDRREHLTAINHSREQRWHVRAAAAADGTLLGLQVRIDADHGAYMRTHGAVVEELAAAMLPGPYRIGAYDAEVRCVLTSKTPTGTYRGPGRYESTFVRERVVDLVAGRLGLDPAEVRRRSFVRPADLPYDTGTRTFGEPVVYDGALYEQLLDVALERIGYAEIRERQARGRGDGRAVGVGLAAFVEKAGAGPWEYASVEVDATGHVLVASGGASVGQGIETVLAQIVADRLGVLVEHVDVLHGDTARVPHGSGAFASRVAIVGGSAAWYAADAVRERATRAAAELLESAVDDLELVDGAFRVRGTPGRAVGLGEIAAACELRAEWFHDPPHATYPGGVHACEVAVDLGTGEVSVERYVIAHDIGRAINPLLVEGQLQGGMAQGLGGALLEALVYDEDGQPLSTSFVDYLLPTTEEVPAATIVCLDSSPAAGNPIGAKGAGESGCTGAGACVANAVADALGAAGARVTRLPLSPAEVRRLLDAP